MYGPRQNFCFEIISKILFLNKHIQNAIDRIISRKVVKIFQRQVKRDHKFISMVKLLTGLKFVCLLIISKLDI